MVSLVSSSELGRKWWGADGLKVKTTEKTAQQHL